MLKKISIFFIAFTLLLSNFCELAFARAGGRSSFSSGRSSSHYSNQGSRGSRTYEGGSSNGKNYAPMEKSKTAPNQNNRGGQNNPQQQQAPTQQQTQNQSFFQRNPMLSTFGAALAGSWIGHMLFGNSGLGGMGTGAGGGGFMLNLLFMIVGAFVVIKLMKFLTSPQPTAQNQWTNQASNNSAAQTTEIQLEKSENNKFAEILVEVQNAWSNQNFDHLRKLTTPEMLKYFSDALSQNTSQGIANKMENVEMISINIAESWREDEMEYATAILEWSALDYMVNLNKNPQDADYVAEGSDKNLIITSEAWTFARYNNGQWILSAIAQVS